MIDLISPAEIKVSPEVEQLLQQIDEEKEKFDRLRPLDDETRERIKIAFLPDRVTASLNMEGIIATRRQTLAIMDSMAIQENSSKTEHEILNALRADELVFDCAQEMKKLSETFIREINSILQDGIDDKEAGYRKIQVQISDAAFCPPSPIEIAPNMQSLVTIYNDSEGINPILRAAWLHARFTYIHPFLDGNGRTGRLLQDFALLQGNLFPTGIPSVERDNYYDALAAADGDIWEPLIQILSLRQLDVTAKAYGIAQERKERSTWIQNLAKRASDKKAGALHKQYLVWSHKMAEIRATFEDTALELSESSPLLQINHENFDIIDFGKWHDICVTGRASRTWLFSQTFYVDGIKVYRCIFYFRRHIRQNSDAFDRFRDAVGLFITGGSGDDNLSFYSYDDKAIRLREVLFRNEETHTYYVDHDTSNSEADWRPIGPESPSDIVRDFYEDILTRKVGL
jgi:Fic family protein